MISRFGFEGLIRVMIASVPDLYILFHYENMPMQYSAILTTVKIDNFQYKIFDSFLIFAQTIDCEYTLEPLLTSTHNLCFGAKIRK